MGSRGSLCKKRKFDHSVAGDFNPTLLLPSYGSTNPSFFETAARWRKEHFQLEVLLQRPHPTFFHDRWVTRGKGGRYAIQSKQTEHAHHTFYARSKRLYFSHPTNHPTPTINGGDGPAGVCMVGGGPTERKRYCAICGEDYR